MGSAAQAERSDYVQAARFVAAALVVVAHTTFYAAERIGSPHGIWHFGEIGVPIFFVISGLVMVLSTQALPADPRGARTFLMRRFVRIVPLYWLATAAKVAVALAAPGVVNHNHFQPDHALKSFLFIPYYNAAGEIRPLHGVGWTLLHEVYFYALFAAALAAGRRPVAWVSAVIVGGWLLGPAFADPPAFVRVATSAVNLHFVLGMAVGWLLVRGPSGPGVLLPGGLATAAAFWLAGTGGAVVTAFAVSVLALAHRPLPAALRPAVLLGDSSYSLYLFHPFVAPALVVVLGKGLGLPALPAIALSCVLTVLLAHGLHLLVERPVVSRVRDSLRVWRLA